MNRFHPSRPLLIALALAAQTAAPAPAPNQALSAAFNARQTSNATRRAPVGELVSVIDDYLNRSGRDIPGYEVGVNWRSPKTRLGTFTLSGDVTHHLLCRWPTSNTATWAAPPTSAAVSSPSIFPASSNHARRHRGSVPPRHHAT